VGRARSRSRSNGGSFPHVAGLLAAARALRYVTSAITALALALARARASTYVARPDATAIAPASLCPLSLLLLPAIPPHSAPRPPPAAFGN
jgi:hypothetical protein